MNHFDITILTQEKYVNPIEKTPYIKNILEEDTLLKNALESLGLSVHRTNWDNKDFDWSTTKAVIFRATWDYFERYDDFSSWLNTVKSKTILINDISLIKWNIDKHYLKDLKRKGINIPKTVFIEPGDKRSLSSICKDYNWERFILKPAVSGAARHTYCFTPSNAEKHEAIFSELIRHEAFLLQEYQENITSKGEIALMVFGGKYSHAVLKKAKTGDFRVQDDFGGTVHPYQPSKEEIEFAEKAFKACSPMPVYARIDVIWDNNNELCIGEIELIEPELWLRTEPLASKRCAKSIANYIKNSQKTE